MTAGGRRRQQGAMISTRSAPLTAVRGALVVLGTLVVLGACGGDDDESMEDFEASMAAPAVLASEAPADFDDAGDFGGLDASAAGVTEETAQTRSSDSETSDFAVGGADDAALAAPTPAPSPEPGRDIIYRASITVQADDVAAASREATAIVEGLGGIVFSQTTRTEPRPQTEMTFKVLPGDFATVLDRLSGVGELVDQTMTADDVTERVVDLESRIITAEASVSRLREFLGDAARLEDVARIESELMDRETTLERLRGQLRTLRGQVDMATITLTVRESPRVAPESGIEVKAWVSEDADDPCLGDEHLTVDPEALIHFCLEVGNPGASVLTDVRISSENVRLNASAFRAVQGDFARIEPGKLLVATLEAPVTDGRLAGRVITRGYAIGLEASAVPVDSEGSPLHQVSGISYVTVEARSQDALPGFGDSVAEGSRLLGSVVGVLVVVFGVLVPFLPFLVVLAAAWWWRRRRRRRRARAASDGAANPAADDAETAEAAEDAETAEAAEAVEGEDEAERAEGADEAEPDMAADAKLSGSE